METYKIVKIVDEYLVVVNFGSDYGAHTGDTLEIFEKGIEVKDPETQESLGTLDVIKARVKIKNVYEKMSLCESAEKVNVSTIYAIGNAFNKVETKALNVNSKEVSGGYDKSSKISVGDLVRIAPDSHNAD